jgi:hypothetical protein
MKISLETLNVPGATLAAAFAVEGRPTYVSRIDAAKLAELLRIYEERHGITPKSKADIAMHVHHHKLLLKLVLDGGKGASDDWVTAAATNMIWSGLNHPGLGQRLRQQAGEMLRSLGRATMLFEAREGALYFYLSPAPIPGATREIDGHADPAAR